MLTALVAVIDDRSTWRALEPADPKSLIAEFNIIDAEVRSALVRRRLWLLALLAGFVVASILLFPLLMSAYESFALSMLG